MPDPYGGFHGFLRTGRSGELLYDETNYAGRGPREERDAGKAVRAFGVGSGHQPSRRNRPRRLAAIRRAFPQFDAAAKLEPDGYWLKTLRDGAARYTIVTAANDRGVLYGAFALLRKIALGEPVGDLDEKQSPFAPVRWINQWDNLDGSIERGYGGRSIFWENDHARADLTRAGEYARLLASLGINGCSINNVNANPRILASDFIPEVARVAAAFRPWGIQVALAVDFGIPQTVGGLDTFDPLDPRVAAWWKSKADEIYRSIPDLAGFVLKADSEGRVGPSAYGRTHADAANAVARALQPHGGLLFYRGFVYDHHMDWRNAKNDRARAAYDNFKQLDGKFDDNVVIQIKNGPIDFQVREPASPLFGELEKTSQAVELQITQEYMGQARHTVFLVPMWKETLDFDMHAGPAPTPVKALVAGKVLHRPAGGFVGVANVGLDENWAGNHISMANLYGFGRLAWDPDLGARRLAEEWTRLTFGEDSKVVETVVGIELSSWRTYENYTGPLGLQTLTDITGDHYGVAVEASERNGWGQWHKADEKGGLTINGTARCWRNSNIRPARRRCGATPSPRGFCALPASPMPRAAWADTPDVSRRSPWRSRASPSRMSCRGKPLPAEKPWYAPRRNARPPCVSTARPAGTRSTSSISTCPPASPAFERWWRTRWSITGPPPTICRRGKSTVRPPCGASSPASPCVRGMESASRACPMAAIPRPSITSKFYRRRWRPMNPFLEPTRTL
jgi:alpha-glucuronidase